GAVGACAVRVMDVLTVFSRGVILRGRTRAGEHERADRQSCAKLQNHAGLVGEAGGIWVLDRQTGQFIWATPFPLDVPEFHISKIDVDTGRTHINWDKVKKHDGDRILVCFHNTRSFWSTAYHPGKNALYIPHSDACLDTTENYKTRGGFGPRRQVMRPGANPAKFTSLAKVNLATGKVEMIHSQPVPGNGSALVTAGDLVFWGDMDRRFRAFDADS